MTNHKTALRTLADIAHRAYFDDDSMRDLDAYMTSTPTDDASLPLPARLTNALDFDLHDLLHNANLSDLIPTADALDDDAYELLSDRFDDRRFAALLARRILA